MKKLLCLILFAMPMIPSPSLEALPDIFVAYGKRNRDIKRTFIEALNTWKKKWKEEGMAVPQDTYMSFVFIPEGQEPDRWQDQYEYPEREKFTYTEYDLKKYSRNVRDMTSFMQEVLSEKEDRDFWYTEKITFQNDSEIRFVAHIKPKPVETKNCLKDGTIDKKIRTHPEYAGKHVICKAIHTGNLKFRVYKYETTNRNLTLQETEYWFQLFDYARIDI
jgi:hypothetical protein